MKLFKPVTWRGSVSLTVLALVLVFASVSLSNADPGNVTPKKIECRGLEAAKEDACKTEKKAQRKAERRSNRIELKAAKKRLLTEDQLENLQDRIDDAREKGKDAKVKTLANNFRQKRKQLKTAWKEAFEDENLSEVEKSILRQEFKARGDDLKRLNTELLTATEKSLRRQVAPTELQAVATVEPNYLYETQTVSFNDPAWPNQWGLQSVGLSAVPIPSGYTLQSQEPIIVALVDSGVNFGHADLNGNMWTDPNCVDADGLAIPGGCPNGGYDFVDRDNDPYPADNITHGTGVASLIGAISNNNTDLASAAGDRVKIMAVRSCCTAQGLFEADSIAEGIYFAVNNGAKIINASFGGPTPSVQIRAALQYAAEHEVLVVAAAGNYASDNDQTPLYPASYNQELPNILSVAATTSWDYLAYFSNYGPQTVDLAAPGQDIITAGLNTGTVTMSGTSFSAPMTASVLAKWWQQNPQLTLAQLKGDFLSALLSLNPITAQVQGGKALRFAVTPTDPAPPDPTPPVDPTVPTPPNPDPNPPTGPVDPNPPTGPVPPLDPPTTPPTTNCKTLTGQAKKDCRARNKAAEEMARFEKKKAKCLAIKKENRRNRCLEKLGLVPGGTSSDIYTYSASGDWSFHHPDHLSGTSVDTDNTGQVIQLYDYYPFGDVHIDNHATGYQNDYQFTGKERDDGTNLLYYEARYYDSALSRFTSLDGWEGDLNDPQSLNQTAYVRNNPLKYVDPSGEFFETPWDVANVVSDAVSIVLGGGMYVTGAATGNGILTSVGAQAIKGGIANIAVDTAATLVPGLPAGAGKVDDASKLLGKAKNKLKPDLTAGGAHTKLKKNVNGNITNFATYKSNPKNPTGFDEVKRVDLIGDPHFNKKTKQNVPTPHVQGKSINGGVRPANGNEIPRNSAGNKQRRSASDSNYSSGT